MKIEWELCNTRKLSVQGALGWDGGIGTHFAKRYGMGIFNTLTYFDGRKTDYFFDKNQHAKFNSHIDAQFQNREFVLSMISEAKEVLEEKFENIQKKLQNYVHLDNRKIAELFNEICYLHCDFYPRKWMAYRICHRIDLQIQEILSRKGKTEEEIQEFLRTTSLPLKPNYPIKEKLDLLRIALEKDSLTKSEIIKKLQEHKRKYRHIPLFDIDDTPFDLEYFRNKLREISDPLEKVQKIRGEFHKRNTNFEDMISEFKQDQKLRDLLHMLKRAVFFRDYADTIRQKMNYELQQFYKEIGKRIGLSINEVVLLTNEEIKKHVQQDRSFRKDEIQRRQKAFLLMPFGDSKILMSGKTAIEEAAALKLYEPIEMKKILPGNTASPGVVEGKARVIYTNKELNQVQEGEIMVTNMTRQDFVPYIGKIRALVTEEGGISCHAAIIARELDLPCIVGTEVATQLIRSGDIIRVNGETGEVEILEQKHH